MSLSFSRRVAARFFFIAGFVLMVLGSALLLGSFAGRAGFSAFPAFFLVMTGIVCAMISIRLFKRPVYIFFAVFFLLAGFFLFLSALGIIPRNTFYQSWPLISVFSGLALLPAGLGYFGGRLIRFIVPSAVFLLLGISLLFFSFDVVEFSFRHFILNWWPLLLCLAAVLIAALFLTAKNGSGDSRQ